MREKEADEYIASLNSYRIVPGLGNITNLCHALGNPEEDLSVIHIAGTNGKGSTAHFISNILIAAGYKVGIYQSPTLLDYRERFMINHRMIPKTKLYSYLELLKQTAAKMTAAGQDHPTAFEMETGLAFRYFADEHCDYVMIETGMGGTLDATNIIRKPLVSVITAIGMDHMQYLGKTIEEITRHKCGIMKSNCPVVALTNELPSVNEVLTSEAAKKNCPLTLVNPSDGKLVKGVQYRVSGIRYHYTLGETKREVKLTATGCYQVANSALALAAIAILQEQGTAISEKAIAKGLSCELPWPGRFEIIKGHPTFVLDGAHNEPAAKQLANSLRTYYPDRPMIMILGVLADKEYEKVIAQLCGLSEHVLTITPPSLRALPAVELAAEVQRQHHMVTSCDSIEEAVELSILLSGPKTVVVACGSLSYMGAIRSAIAHRKDITHGR